MSKNERLSTLEDWLFETRLSTKEERRKAIASARDEDLIAYYQAVISRNKKPRPQKAPILMFKY